MAGAFCGCAMIEGAALIVRVAALLLADPLLASVTMTRYSGEPAVEKPLRVKVAVVAPATPAPLLRLVKVAPLSVEICHW